MNDEAAPSISPRVPNLSALLTRRPKRLVCCCCTGAAAGGAAGAAAAAGRLRTLRGAGAAAGAAALRFGAAAVGLGARAALRDPARFGGICAAASGMAITAARDRTATAAAAEAASALASVDRTTDCSGAGAATGRPCIWSGMDWATGGAAETGTRTGCGTRRCGVVGFGPERTASCPTWNGWVPIDFGSVSVTERTPLDGFCAGSVVWIIFATGGTWRLSFARG